MKSDMEPVNRPRLQARKSYNAMSHWYDLFTGSEKRITDIGVNMLDVQSNESILEIGCGTGHALALFTKTSNEIFAIDISENMLRIARGRLGQDTTGLCQADAMLIPFPNNLFDCIFISFALELFDTPEIPKVLQEILRVLKEGGRLGVVSLSKQETTAVLIYEWFHRRLPNLVDCRPIHLESFLKASGFLIQYSTLKRMWGLPVEIAVGRKWS